MVVIGFQAMIFALFTQIYASQEGFLPKPARVGKVLANCTLERGLLAGGVLASVGVAGLVAAFMQWQAARFGHLNYEVALRVVVPSVTALILSCQMILGTFFISILGIHRTKRPVILEVSAGSEIMAAQPGLLQARFAEPVASGGYLSELDDAPIDA
jgi:hypothetical protein